MVKVVINSCYGGFSLSEEAKELLQKKTGLCPINRDHPDLVSIVETLGKKANGKFAYLKIVEIPNDVKWQIEEYDGAEWVSECHRTWE